MTDIYAITLQRAYADADGWINVTHNLGTRDIAIKQFDVESGEEVHASVERLTENTLRMRMGWYFIAGDGAWIWVPDQEWQQVRVTIIRT